MIAQDAECPARRRLVTTRAIRLPGRRRR